MAESENSIDVPEAIIEKGDEEVVKDADEVVALFLLCSEISSCYFTSSKTLVFQYTTACKTRQSQLCTQLTAAGCVLQA